MHAHRLAVLGLAALALATGCSSDKKSSGGSASGYITMTAAASSVVADGTNTVALTFNNTTGTAATVSTDKGLLSVAGGTPAASISVTAASTTVTLTSCDVDGGACTAGIAHITATAGVQSASATVTFLSLTTACSSNCAADDGCLAKSCSGGTGYTCQGTPPALSCSAPSGGGGGGGGGGTPTYSIEIVPAKTKLPPDGTSTSSVVVTVKSDGAVSSGQAVTLSADRGSLSATTGTTGTDGTVTVTFTAPVTGGNATITASTVATPVVTATATIVIPRLGYMTFADPPAQYQVQGIAGSGWQEFGWLQVQVLDDLGDPYIEGATVRFEHKKLGGSTLSSPTVACSTPSSNCVAYLGKTDASGLSSVWLYSGTAAGTLEVTATVTAGGITRSLALPTVAVIGARASATNFSIMCSQRNIPALAQHDCGVSWVDAPFTCVSLAKDRYNNLLGTASQVIFASEASGVGQVSMTPAYDPTKKATDQPDLGQAVQIFQTMGAGLPFDVPPQTGEPSFDHGLDGCGVRTHNPRDGAVTIVAMIDGEEAFFDANGNGRYDGGEPFTDQGEPFMDQNDNGTWDVGEWFLDVDGDGLYDDPNTTWDANSKIWTQTVVLYTGTPLPMFDTSGAGDYLGVRFATTLGTVPVGGDYGPACVPSAFPADFTVLAGDPPTVEFAAAMASDHNLNMLTSQTSYWSEVGTGGIAVAYHGPQYYADSLGFFYQYWPCDQAGNCASQCRATGTDLPCVMTPKITSFSCGPIGEIMAIGGATADGPAMLDKIFWFTETPYKMYANNNQTAKVWGSWYGYNL